MFYSSIRSDFQITIIQSIDPDFFNDYHISYSDQIPSVPSNYDLDTSYDPVFDVIKQDYDIDYFVWVPSTR